MYGDNLLGVVEPPALRRLLREQDSVVSRAQALKAGLSRHAIEHRLRDGGPWRVLLPAVYLALPGAPTQGQRDTAATIYGGRYGVITGPAALRYFQFRVVAGWRTGDVVDLLIPARFRRLSTGFVRVHRTRVMPDWTRGPAASGYASPPRAVADTARWLTSLREVRAVVGEAVQNRHCTVEHLVSELRAGGTSHSALLRKAVEEAAAGVRSAPEAELRDLIARAGLPTPLFNPRLFLPDRTFIASPDVWWPEAGVAVEVDSRQWHLAPDDWERTMNRHSNLAQYGIVTLHVTPHQLRTAPVPLLRKAANAYKAGISRPRLNILTVPAAA
jgi:hypothetical protein